MAFVNLIISKSSEIAGIKIDGTISETTSETMLTTSNPLEDGVIITDHVVRQPRTFVMEGVITNTPLIGAGFTESVAYTLGGVVNRLTGGIGSSLPSGASRSSQSYEKLRELMLKREPLTIKTNLGEVQDLIFTSLTVPQDKDTANAIFFTATFIEILIVRQSLIGVDANRVTDPEVAASVSNSLSGGTISPLNLQTAKEQNILNSSVGRVTTFSGATSL